MTKMEKKVGKVKKDEEDEKAKPMDEKEAKGKPVDKVVKAETSS